MILFCWFVCLFVCFSVPVYVPAGITVFPYDTAQTPRPLVELKYRNIVQFNEFHDGGHFAAFENPSTMADEIRSFVKKVQNVNADRKSVD